MNERAMKTPKLEQRTVGELSDLLEQVKGFTVGKLQKLYEEFTGEITRSRNKPSLIKRVSAQITMISAVPFSSGTLLFHTE